MSNGVVFKGDDGKLYLRLNWEKRYITLATIATLMGLAFRLRDPDKLLGKGEDVPNPDPYKLTSTVDRWHLNATKKSPAPNRNPPASKAGQSELPE